MGFIMATLYQNKGHWLLTVHHKGRRLTKSLGTKDKKVAKQLKPYVESELLLELTGLKKATSQVAFPVLTDKFLKADKKRSKRTQELYEYVFIVMAGISIDYAAYSFSWLHSDSNIDLFSHH